MYNFKMQKKERTVGDNAKYWHSLRLFLACAEIYIIAYLKAKFY